MQTKAIRHRALLARRSPPRCSRWRSVRPEDTGIGAARRSAGPRYARLISSLAATHARVAPAGTGQPQPGLHGGPAGRHRPDARPGPVLQRRHILGSDARSSADHPPWRAATAKHAGSAHPAAAAIMTLSWPGMTGLPWCRARWKDRRCDAYGPDSDSRARAGPAGPAGGDYRRGGGYDPWPGGLTGEGRGVVHVLLDDEVVAGCRAALERAGWGSPTSGRSSLSTSRTGRRPSASSDPAARRG